MRRHKIDNYHNSIRLHRNESLIGEWNQYPDIEYYYSLFKCTLGYKNMFFTEGVSGGIKNIFEVLRPSEVFYDSDFSLYPIFEKQYKGNGPSIQFITDPKTELMLDVDYIVIDDVYQYFHSTDWDKMLPNVTILRSFSKACGLAGLRIGYMTGELTEQISQYRGGYEANSFSLETAYTKLKNIDNVLHYVYQCKLSLEYLLQYDIYKYNGYSNYVICNKKFSHLLDHYGYKVKDIDGGMRITLAPLDIIKPLNEMILKWI